jgi:D-hexose-6-phosphate mutarotase
MIHYDNYYSNSQNSSTIIQGLEYLICQQVKNQNNSLSDGGIFTGGQEKVRIYLNKMILQEIYLRIAYMYLKQAVL